MTGTAHLLDQAFYARPALVVARELLGKSLVRQIGSVRHAAVIHEVEAYIGPQDLACHARAGCTPRTAVMYGPGGHWYVYLCYGMHWMLNVVTGEESHPAAVLFRSAGTFIGPGRLTKGLRIDRRHNTKSAVEATGLWIEVRGLRVRKSQIERTPRIGVDYAGSWKDKPYRFVWKA